MQKRDAEIIQHGKVYLTKWFSAEHREEGHEKVQRYTSDIFFGAEHRMRKEEMEEQFNEKAKQGWRFAADAARDCKQAVRIANTRREEFCGSRQQFGSSYWQRRRILGNEGRMAQPWVTV